MAKTAKKINKLPPTNLPDALERLREVRAAGRKWRDRAEAAEATVESQQRALVVCGEELAEAHNLISQLKHDLATGNEIIAQLREEANNSERIDALDVVAFIKAARDQAVADVRAAVQEAFSQYVQGEDDSVEDDDDLDENEEHATVEADDDDSDDDSDDDDSDDDDSDDSDEDEAATEATAEAVIEPTSEEVEALATDIVEGNIDPPEVNLQSSPLDTLCHIITQSAEELGDVWAETFGKFAENAAVKPRLLINEVVSTVFDDADQRAAILASLDELSADEFNTVLQTVLSANGGVLAALVPTN